ncbi:MAG: hypothetical protein SFT90_08105 [Rickettsiales bacterium]|nr:hypothetical protein [Rickettsiales bacterium]
METEWGSKALDGIRNLGEKISNTTEGIKLKIFRPTAKIISTEGQIGKNLTSISNGITQAVDIIDNKTQIFTGLTNVLSGIKTTYQERVAPTKNKIVDGSINLAAKMLVTMGNVPKTTAYLPAFISCYYRSMEIVNQMDNVSGKELAIKSVGVLCATLSNVLGTMAVIKIADKETYNSIIKAVTNIDLSNSKRR